MNGQAVPRVRLRAGLRARSSKHEATPYTETHGSVFGARNRRAEHQRSGAGEFGLTQNS